MNEVLQVALAVIAVILSIGFIVFLAVGIAALFVLFKILKNVRHVTERLDETSQNVGELAKYMGRKVGPAAASAVVSVLLRQFKSGFKRKK